MKTIIGFYNPRTQYLSCELPLFTEYWVQGEIYYNRALSRYEHLATDADGAEYLVIA